MTKFPKDPFMLLSFINMRLRDTYPTMEELCKALDADREEIDAKLASIDYEYDELTNRYL